MVPFLLTKMGMNLEKQFALAQSKVDSDAGRLADAANSIKSVLDSFPDDMDARETLAELVGKQGRRDLEVGILVEILQEDASRWQSAKLLVESLVLQGSVDDAKELVAGFALANPKHIESREKCLELGVNLNELTPE